MIPTQAPPARLALFDLDHTLLPLDSDYRWADFLARAGHVGDPATACARNEELMRRYDAGKLTAAESAEFMLGLLAGNTPYDLARWHEDFMAQVIRPAISAQAIALVREHLEAGDLCAIATSTNTFVTAPIARAFGIPVLLGTEPEYTAGRYTGRIDGIACFREGKVARVNQWLAGLGWQLSDFRQSFFYSDSMNDVPLLEAVTDPIAANPSAALRELARERGWRITDLFA
ncbi:HAD family hydrolase [Pigmentiphaga sp.]|uniref:HAD family hydrolase n=1 Tax=Pigmentiphaga sp. TaxID=1977564 RepID=UPI00128E038E|nr:HAD family hydrolase [Pigmentiphaga sp.]MPS30268.1 HAD family hydrolase [Alcaligenaceae bacterium SAGV5]MPS53013.1 HAD family hydrolase [Alcaligenaceae bacterium SAGV3]MPT56780.1 HAD family hydrolase [Alcaligenaceae bacterium]